MKAAQLAVIALLIVTMFAAPVHADFFDFVNDFLFGTPIDPGFGPGGFSPLDPGLGSGGFTPIDPGLGPGGFTPIDPGLGPGGFTPIDPTTPTTPIVPIPFDPISDPNQFPFIPPTGSPIPGSPIPFPPTDQPVVNLPPVLNQIGNKIISEGQTLVFSVSGSDPENGPLNFGASALPSGASFSGQTFSWTPSFSQSGSYSVTFNVVDNTGQQDAETVSIVVLDVGTGNNNQAPVFLSQPITTAFVREFYYSPVVVMDPNGDNVALSLTTAPAGMQLAYVDTGYTVYGEFVDEGDTETETDSLTARTFSVQVHDVTSNSCDVTLNGVQRLTLQEDVNYMVTLNGIQYLVTAEPDAFFGDCYVEIFDQKIVTGWLIWTPEPNQIGAHTVSVTASDGQASTAQTFTVTVTIDPRLNVPREDVDKPREDIKVNTIAIQDSARSGDEVLVTLNFENSGDFKLDTVEAGISIPELGIRSPTVGPIDLRQGKDASRTLMLEIPQDTLPGLYTVRVTVDSGSVHRIVHRDIEILE